MPLTTVRQEIAHRFQEARTFLSAIKTLEQTSPHAAELQVQKGLFLVLLYGAFEYSLTRTMIEITVFINSRRVEMSHVSEPLYALALEPQLTSCATVGRDYKWQRRVELFLKQASSDLAILHDGPFLTQMENMWANTIQKMFKVFGVSVPALYEPRVRQYIDEVVDKRNAVSHGRESAANIGQAYTTGGLQNLLDELTKQVQYVLSVFEVHLLSKAFVKAAFQGLY
jgi:hypothetical protein